MNKEKWERHYKDLGITPEKGICSDGVFDDKEWFFYPRNYLTLKFRLSRFSFRHTLSPSRIWAFVPPLHSRVRKLKLHNCPFLACESIKPLT